MWKSKTYLTEKTTILPLEICLLPVEAGVKTHAKTWDFSQKKNRNRSKRHENPK